MNTLIDWYPGDSAVIAAFTVLGMIFVIVGATWIAAQLRARGRAALRSALWLSALIGVLATPALAAIGPYVPWRVAVVPVDEARTAERSVPKVELTPPASAVPVTEISTTAPQSTPRSAAVTTTSKTHAPVPPIVPKPAPAPTPLG